MTNKEIAQKAYMLSKDPTFDLENFVETALRQTASEERKKAIEECAKVADEYEKKKWIGCGRFASRTFADLSQAIRKLGSE